MGDGDWWIALAMVWRTLPGCGGGGDLGARAAFKFGALRLGYLWLYGSSRE